MKFSTIASAFFTSLLVSSVKADDSLPPIEIVGNKFFYSNNGSQFYIRGIAYQSDVANETAQQSFSDPLADGASCKRDLPYLQKVQTNVLRVYALNTSLDHTECMNLFSDAGIYIIADLSEPGLSVDRDDPKWSVDLYNRYTSVIDDFHNYTNVLGFFAGNEVTNNNTNTDASPFVKAAIRDMKSYMKDNNYRQIPVGYSSNDDADTRLPMAEFFACGDDSERADFYGINMYEWCGNSNFVESGYQARTEEFEGLNIPLFFSEYGCNQVQPRKFTEVATIYSDNMTDVWSGGIVYMYYQEANDYGLVSIVNDAVSTLPDFNFLSSEIAAVTPTIGNSASIKINSTQVACPASTGTAWRATPKLPPTPNAGICECVSPAMGCVVDSSVDEEDYSKLFSYLCGQVSCDGISGNGTSGEYGAFSFCDAESQLNFVLNLYYESQNKAGSACDFNGSASVNSSPSTAKACAAVLQQAGSVGTGSVTASVSATGTSGSSDSNSNSASTTGSSSGSSSTTTSSSKSGAASINSSSLKLAAGVFGSIILTFSLIF